MRRRKGTILKIKVKDSGSQVKHARILRCSLGFVLPRRMPVLS